MKLNLNYFYLGRMLQQLPPKLSAPRITPYDLFMSWCQTCRHGGHAAHMDNWFKKHVECPVTGCTCPCSTLDPDVLDTDSEFSDSEEDSEGSEESEGEDKFSEDGSEAIDLVNNVDQKMVVGTTQTN